MKPFGLLDNLMRSHRKRSQISLDGTVAGLPSPRRCSNYHYPGSEFVSERSGAAGNSEYLGSWPHDYEPSPGRMELSITEYEPYEADRVFQVNTPPLTLDPVHFDVGEPEDTPSYNDGLATGRLLMEAWLQELHSAHGSEPAPLYEPLGVDEAGAPPDSLEQIIDQEMAVMQMREIEDAVEQQINEAMAPPEPELPDPFEMHNEQMQQLMDPFGMMGPGPMM